MRAAGEWSIRGHSHTPLVRWPLVAIFLATALPPLAQAQLEGEESETFTGSPIEAEVLDFGSKVAGDVNVEVTTQVVRAELFMADILTVGSAAVAKVCGSEHLEALPVVAGVSQDIATFGQVQIGFNVTIFALPPTDGGRRCVDKFMVYGYGPDEPPYNDNPEPPFRELLAMELKQLRTTRALDMTKWRVKLSNASCDEMKVIHHDIHPTAPPTLPPVVPTSEPECTGELPPADWSPDMLGDPWNLGEITCAHAMSPCLCATLSNNNKDEVPCTWYQHESGGYRCRNANVNGRVSCDDCPFQADCPVDPAVVCLRNFAPCACMLSVGDCYWDSATAKCMVELDPDNKVGTECKSCSRQWKCSKPAVLNIRPLSLEVMGKPETGWVINVTFDRDILFNHVPEPVLLRCRGMAPTPVYDVPLDMMWVSEGNVFKINVSTIQNDAQRDCDLVIADRAITDPDYIAYSGLNRGEHTVTLVDRVPPRIHRFVPATSETGVPTASVLEVQFNEFIVVNKGDPETSPPCVIELYSLGAERIEGREADVLVTQFFLPDAPEVTFINEGSVMLVDTSALLQPGLYYSLSLPRVCLRDRMGNAYPGLEVGVWAFQTEVPFGVATSAALEKDTIASISPVAWGLLLAAAAMTAGLLVLSLVICVRMQTLKPRRGPSNGSVAEVAADNGPPVGKEKDFRRTDMDFTPWEPVAFDKAPDLATLALPPSSPKAVASTPKAVKDATKNSLFAAPHPDQSLPGQPSQYPGSPSTSTTSKIWKNPQAWTYENPLPRTPSAVRPAPAAALRALEEGARKSPT